MINLNGGKRITPADNFENLLFRTPCSSKKSRRLQWAKRFLGYLSAGRLAFFGRMQKSNRHRACGCRRYLFLTTEGRPAAPTASLTRRARRDAAVRGAREAATCVACSLLSFFARRGAKAQRRRRACRARRKLGRTGKVHPKAGSRRFRSYFPSSSCFELGNNQVCADQVRPMISDGVCRYRQAGHFRCLAAAHFSGLEHPFPMPPFSEPG